MPTSQNFELDQDKYTTFEINEMFYAYMDQQVRNSREDIAEDIYSNVERDYGIKVGDHLITDRIFYTHHGIYVGNGEVIHYSGLAKNFVLKDFLTDGFKKSDDIAKVIKSAKIEKVSFADFIKGNKFGVIEHPSSQFTAKEIVNRAYTRINEQNYNIIFNNCEHFANWCIYDNSKSSQIETATNLICDVASIMCNSKSNTKTLEIINTVFATFLKLNQVPSMKGIRKQYENEICPSIDTNPVVELIKSTLPKGSSVDDLIAFISTNVPYLLSTALDSYVTSPELNKEYRESNTKSKSNNQTAHTSFNDISDDLLDNSSQDLITPVKNDKYTANVENYRSNVESLAQMYYQDRTEELSNYLDNFEKIDLEFEKDECEELSETIKRILDMKAD